MSDADDTYLVSVLLKDNFIKQCIQVAICTILIYDTMITMAEEIKYFWTCKRHSLTHILFFLNRYVGILGAIAALSSLSLQATASICSFSIWIDYISGAFIVVIIDYILILRVLALWNNNKTISVFLRSLFSCEVIAKFILGSVVVNVQQPHPIALTKEIVICIVESNRYVRAVYFLFIDWIVISAVGCILFLLALFKTIRHWKISGIQGHSLVNIMITDQIIYYLMVIFCSAINIATSSINYLGTFSIAKEAIFSLLGSPSFLCLLGSRMFLNLKEAAEVNSAINASVYNNSNLVDSVIISTDS